ncbi:type II toxin-antitoxin system RelE family toxin [Pararhizobium gei]|uniref:type II toxin-antitoxin system RelE family toxin n=1 Tax=Pararhizobium gei TaxID=1395951 RepID=UPI0023DB5E1A|nr:cytotoxic translational repressor of toxin-antitoxin stability system [Rhizobium gei]
MKTVHFSSAADKALQKMQPKRKLAILEKLGAYARGEQVDIKKLKNQELYRIRVGGDRVIIDDEGRVVMVVAVGPRGGIYKE